MADAYEQLTIESVADWRAWLEAHHATTPGVWLVTYKRRAGARYVAYDDVVDEAIAYGWIDSRPRALDEQRSQRLVTPRRPGSRWSRVNKLRVERLLAAGRMTEAGLRAIEVAKATGTWDALDEVEDLVEPADLRRALAAHPGARGHWDAFPRSTRRAILEWIGAARRTATRQARVEETARLAARGERANQWRRPAAPPPAQSG